VGSERAVLFAHYFQIGVCVPVVFLKLHLFFFKH